MHLHNIMLYVHNKKWLSIIQLIKTNKYEYNINLLQWTVSFWFTFVRLWDLNMVRKYIILPEHFIWVYCPMSSQKIWQCSCKGQFGSLVFTTIYLKIYINKISTGLINILLEPSREWDLMFELQNMPSLIF